MHILSRDPGRAFICDECGRSFTTRGNLNVHLKIHAGKRDFKCPLCPKSFIVRSHLRSHMSLHEEKQFQCKLCDLKFHRKTTLNYHMNAVHEDVRNFQCPVCKKSFKGHLTDHMRIHSAEKPYMCEECGARFRQRSQLKVHWRQHTGTKPYVCTMCTKTFRHSTALKIHMQNHNGEKPYGCSICSRPFGQLSHLKKHLKTIHSVLLPYLCRVCNQSFSTQAKLCHHWEFAPECAEKSKEGEKGGLVLLHTGSKGKQRSETVPSTTLSVSLSSFSAASDLSCSSLEPITAEIPENATVTTTLTLEEVEGFADSVDRTQSTVDNGEYLTLSNVGAVVSDGILVCNGREDEFSFWTYTQPLIPYETPPQSAHTLIPVLPEFQAVPQEIVTPLPVLETQAVVNVSKPSEKAKRRGAALAVRRLAIDGTVRLPYAFAGKKLRSGRNLQLENGTSNADELDIIRESIIKGSKIPPKFDNNFGKKSQLKNYDEDEEVTEIILSRSLACARFPSPVKFLVEKENGVLRLRALGVDLRAIEELDAFKAVDGDIPIIGGDSFTQPTVKRKRGRPRKLRPGL